MIKQHVGVEAEFFLLDKKGEAKVPPSSWDRDDFPLLGEIRGDKGKDAASTYSNFMRRQMEIKDRISKDNSIASENVRRIKLAVYKKAMAELRDANADKPADAGKIRNIYGTDISDFSDQVIGANKKIQGINASCGLHIHFSCEEVDEYEVNERQYEQVTLPLSDKTRGIELDLHLYRYKDYKKEKILIARASQLNKPTVEWIVKQMDDAFFERFAPKKEERTKYRQPGFYELKPYGFEYRSLPANKASIEALPEIITFAFKLLEDTRF